MALPLWTFPPNWNSPIKETLEWLTDVLQSPSGAEQRRALRLAPRRSFTFEVLVHQAQRTRADLWAHVLGAQVPRNPVPEIGWYPLQKTAAGLDDPVLAPLQAQTPVFQWHSCRFDIPASAVHLASSADCAQQAFRYGDNAYGFQFHLEMDQPLIERWLANPAYREELTASGLAHDAASIRAQTLLHIAAMQQQADAVFNNFLDLVGRPQRRHTLPSREWV